MKLTKKTVIASAAIAGLLTGAVVTKTYGEDAPANKPGKEAAGKKAPKVHDCAGMNDCKGLGGCKTKEHDCKAMNDCKGKGGCHVTKEDVKNWEKKNKKKETNKT